MTKEKTVWYKLICRQCDDDGYQSYVMKLPINSQNINNPNSSGHIDFEILPHDHEGYVRIKHKCKWCNGLKHYLYCSDAWNMVLIEPK